VHLEAVASSSRQTIFGIGTLVQVVEESPMEKLYGFERDTSLYWHLK
jgi:hypothetical protein